MIECPAEWASAPTRRGTMNELQEKIIKRILESEDAMIIALEFIQKDRELQQEPSDDQQASPERPL